MTDDHQAAFLRSAQQLLAIESTEHKPSELERALQYVLDYIGPNVSVERFTRNGKPSALVYTAKKRPDNFRIILNGHVDVLAGTSEQFRPHVTDGKLHARGALDMKVATLLQATAFRELARKVDYPLALQVVTDEEVGGDNGTKLQVEQGVRGDFVVGAERSELNITVDSKGIVNAIFTAQGKPGHSAYPWLYRNPIDSLMQALTKLRTAYPRPQQEAWVTTCTISSVTTDGTTFNQTSSRADALVSFRFVHDDPHFAHLQADQILTYLQTFCMPGMDVVLERCSYSVHTETDHPDVLRLAQAISEASHEPQFIRRHGAYDVRHYTPVGGTGVSFGLDGADMHGPNEFVHLASIPKHYAGLRRFLRLVNEA